MGGDHKCPVCHATFTRPQHVARHMRSHTGDRPYKCQYCGDQFARSDLLSRHVNKCHANEKPLPNQGSRRKGMAATRATTSRQACDQCVQSSLPCDGANPCAKCITRKCRCTFVKFHRQTAPVGPGHNTRGLLGTTQPRAGPLYSQSPAEDFLLPHQSQSHTAAATLDALYSHQGQGSHHQAYGHGAYGTAGLYGAGAAAAGGLDDPNAYGAGIAAASGYAPAAAAGASDPNWMWSAAAGTGAAEPQQQHQHGSYAQQQTFTLPGSAGSNGAAGFRLNPPPPSRANHYSQSSHHGSTHHSHTTHPSSGYQRQQQIDMQSARDSRRHSIASDFDTGSEDSHGGSGGGGSRGGSSAHLPLIGGGAGAGGAGGGGGGGYRDDYRSTSSAGSRPPTSSGLQQSTSTTTTSSSSHPQGHNIQPGEDGKFSSAFGLMSIEDPAVLAGISEGIPFFSEPGSTAPAGAGLGIDGIEGMEGIEGFSAPPSASSVSPQLPGAAAGAGAVPGSAESARQQQQQQQRPATRLLSSYNLTPPLTQRPSTSSGLLPPLPALASLPAISGPAGDTPSREAETRELREFWKQYMSTPLTGPGSGTTPMEFTAPAPLGAAGSGSGSGGPNTPGRRPRGNSLPSISPPTNQTANGGFLPNQQGQVAVNGYVRGQGGFTLQPPPASLKPSTSSSNNNNSSKPPSQSQGLAMATPLPQNASGMRTTLHGNPDDLRSYEAAVLARKPVSLYLAPKMRKATAPAGSGGSGNKNGNNNGLPQPPPSPSRLRSASVSGGGVHHEGMPPPKSTSPRRSVGDDRGSFSSASSSSLISAFGAGAGGHSRDSSVTSLSSVDSSCIPNSSELDAASTASTRGGSLVPSMSTTPSQSSQSQSSSKFSLSPASWRPSFKRLASQTLEQPGDPKKFFGAGSLETPRGEINNPYDSFAAGADWSSYRHGYEKEESEDSAYGGEEGDVEGEGEGEENESDEYDASNSGSGSGGTGSGSGSGGSGEAGYGTPAHVPELGGVRVIELSH